MRRPRRLPHLAAPGGEWGSQQRAIGWLDCSLLPVPLARCLSLPQRPCRRYPIFLPIQPLFETWEWGSAPFTPQASKRALVLFTPHLAASRQAGCERLCHLPCPTPRSAVHDPAGLDTAAQLAVHCSRGRHGQALHCVQVRAAGCWRGWRHRSFPMC